MGGYFRTGDAAGDYEERIVTRVLIHPKFQPLWTKNEYFNYDIALLVLNASVSKAPIKLPQAVGE